MNVWSGEGLKSALLLTGAATHSHTTGESVTAVDDLTAAKGFVSACSNRNCRGMIRFFTSKFSKIPEKSSVAQGKVARLIVAFGKKKSRC